MSVVTVLDTSSLVSAILSPRSVPAQAADLAFRSGDVLVSSETRNEAVEVIGRGKFERYLPEATRKALAESLLAGMLPVLVHHAVRVCRDPKDDKFLSLALAGAADFLITSDDDLLDLYAFLGTRIITPAEFLTCVR